MTTAGTKWSGWRGLCRGWGSEFFAATWLCCEGVAEAFPSKRRSKPIRTVRRRQAAREGGTTGRDAWRWLSVRLMLGGRSTVVDRVGGRNDRSANRHGARMGWFMARDRSPRLPNYQKAEPSARSLERGEDGAPLISAKPHSGRPRPTAASRMSPPWSEAQGSAAAAGMSEAKRSGATGDRGSSRRAATAQPKERLDWRGMCRGVRGTSRHAQMP